MKRLKTTLVMLTLLLSQICEASLTHKDIIDDAEKMFQPLARQAHGRFVLSVDNDRQSISAAAQRNKIDLFEVILDGGLLNWPRLTEDSLRMTLCHEAGHLFGGVPLRPAPMEWEGPLDSSGLSLLSAEGQADYYAASCFRQWTRGQRHEDRLKKVPAVVLQKCDQRWGGQSEDSLLCQRIALAGKAFLNLVKDFDIDFETPDTEVVEETEISGYPSRQCRLDTFFAGALEQTRPACWYKK